MGGVGYYPKNELELFKKKLCEFLRSAIKNHFGDDIRKVSLMSDSSEKAIKGILDVNYAVFTSDELLRILSMLYQEKKEILDNTDFFIEKESPVDFIKKKESKKIVDLINLPSFPKNLLPLEVIEALREGNIETFAIDYLISLRGFIEQITATDNQLDFSASRTVKNQIAKEIKTIVSLKKITHTELADLSGIKRPNVTKILNERLDAVSIELLLDFVQKISHKHPEFFLILKKYI